MFLCICMSFVDWLEKRQMPCFYQSTYGIECPGCGMQRSIIALLRGNWSESLSLYPALLPTFILLALLVVHVCFKLKHGAKWIVGLFIANTVIVIISYLYKLIN